MALQAAGLGLPAATLAAAMFVLLPVHGGERRLDHRPRGLDAGALLHAVRSSRSPLARQRVAERGLYALSLALLFVALFTKQNDHHDGRDPGGVGPRRPGLADGVVATRSRPTFRSRC